MDFAKKVRSFQGIEWTKTTLTICAIPLALSFIVLHIIFLILEERVGAIVSDSQICTEIGRDVLLEDGSVVDAAIAIIFCESVLLPHRVSIGGGFSAVIYMGRRIETIMATPKVPYGFQKGYIDNNYSFAGAEGSAVPGTLMGCWQMHRKYGILSWKRLIEPSIELCESGVLKEDMQTDMDSGRTISEKLRNMVLERILKTQSGNTGGEKLKFLVFAQTLRLIAIKGADVFYNGAIGEELIRDMQEDDGVMTMADLRDYNVSWSFHPVSFRVRRDEKAYTTPLPTSGAIVALVFNVIRSIPGKSSPLFWHKTIEAMKHAYGLSFNLADIEYEENENFVEFVRQIYEKMLDNDFAVHVRNLISDERLYRNLSYYGVEHKQSHQSSSGNICITSSGGDAIVLTADMLVRDTDGGFYSESTGVLLNNQMRTFWPMSTKQNLPPSPNSFLRPGKRAFSSHCPVMVLKQKKSEAHFLVSASGDETAAAQVITSLINNCFERKNALKTANSFFFYPDILNEKVLIQLANTEEGINPQFLMFLKKVGHNATPILNMLPYAIRSVVVQNSLKPEADFTYQEEGGINTVDPKTELNLFLMFIFVGISAIIILMICVEIVGKTNRLLTPISN